MKNVVAVVFAVSVQLCTAGGITVRDGDAEWRFVEVNGTSRLPLEFMRTGEGEEKLDVVTLPRYWIAEKMVTEADFASVMGRKMRKQTDATRAVKEIEWDEARLYCERFAAKYRAQLPGNCLVSMPSMIEWAHAVRALDGKVDLCGEVGTFLFTGSAFGGYLHTLWQGAKPLSDAAKANEQLAWNLAVIPKRLKSEKVGLRMVIVDVTKGMLDDHPVVSRGVIALQHGHFAAARQLLELAKTHGNLSSNELERAEDALAFSKRKHEEDVEDWSGLVAVSSRVAMKDHVVEPFCGSWQLVGWEDGPDDKIAKAYAQAGIVGEWMRIGALPREIRSDQPLGKEHHVLCAEGEKQVRFKVSTNTFVQVLKCDFSGDGKRDLIVETFGAVGSNGYWYNFYERLPNGVFTNVYELQTVGLCALPRKNGQGCGFLCVDKCSNPVLSARLLSYSKGKMSSVSANDKPFYMIDAREGHIYMSAPFIGGGSGLGWWMLEGRDVWYRPLYWPWKAGTVQRE